MSIITEIANLSIGFQQRKISRNYVQISLTLFLLRQDNWRFEQHQIVYRFF